MSGPEESLNDTYVTDQRSCAVVTKLKVSGARLEIANTVVLDAYNHMD